jgi:hypothetical protein
MLGVIMLKTVMLSVEFYMQLGFNLSNGVTDTLGFSAILIFFYYYYCYY